MANIKKNFNFRNGVQVDDDNLLVTSTGLVGIGTTVPTEALDVRGNVKIIGDATITNATVGVLTITNVDPTQIIGAGVSIKSGIITAQGSGIVTFFGDARFLQGMPTSQWIDTNAGFGVSSIYNTGGTVGIATTNPQSTLQVGNNVDGGETGVGISSAGNINASGIVTASSFFGDLTGDVTGNVTGNLTGNISSDTVVSGIATFNNRVDINAQTELQNTIVTGFVTFFPTGGTKFFTTIDADGDLDVDGHTELDQLNVSGVSTFAAPIDLNSDLDVDGHTNLDNVSVAGVTTFAGIIEGVAGQNKIPFLYSSMTDLPSAGSYHGAVAHVHATGSLYYAHAGNWWELVNKESDGRVGTGTEIYNVGNIVSSGIITATTELNSPLIGVGTDAPANAIQVRKTSNAEIQVTSDTGIAGLTVGREPSTGNTNNAEFRYGRDPGFNYSSAQSVDIINYGTGNFNYHLSAANGGNVEGDFHWHRGKNTARLMTLTGIGGSLGIGITTPSTPLHVLGAATISGNVILGGDLDVTGNANMQVVGNVVGNLFGNVNATTGVSTFKRLDLDTTSYYEFGELSAAGVGIGTTMGFYQLAVNDDADKKFTISDSGNVGIKTTSVNGNALLVSGDTCILETVGVGTNVPTAAVDFSLAGQALGGAAINRMFMIPPKVTNAQRGNLTGLQSGAMIYNTNLNKLQVYNGSAWETITSSV